MSWYIRDLTSAVACRFRLAGPDSGPTFRFVDATTLGLRP